MYGIPIFSISLATLILLKLIWGRYRYCNWADISYCNLDLFYFFLMGNDTDRFKKIFAGHLHLFWNVSIRSFVPSPLFYIGLFVLLRILHIIDPVSDWQRFLPICLLWNAFWFPCNLVFTFVSCTSQATLESIVYACPLKCLMFWASHLDIGSMSMFSQHYR